MKNSVSNKTFLSLTVKNMEEFLRAKTDNDERLLRLKQLREQLDEAILESKLKCQEYRELLCRNKALQLLGDLITAN